MKEGGAAEQRMLSVRGMSMCKGHEEENLITFRHLKEAQCSSGIVHEGRVAKLCLKKQMGSNHSRPLKPY